MSHNDTTRAVESAFVKMGEAVLALSSGPASFYMEKMRTYADALFGRFAPFKRGDRVRLTRAPNGVHVGSHWWGIRDRLQAGATGTVSDVDYRDGHFVAMVVLDDDGAHTFAIEDSALELTAPPAQGQGREPGEEGGT